MQVPEEAKLVFKGVIFSVYQWEQMMFDGSTATFEMLKRNNTIQVIATQGEKIFMSRQSQPNKSDYHSLFGGRAEENEDPLVTAKRELLEESGLESDDWELFTVYNPAYKMQWDIYMYIARNCKKVQEPKPDAGEQIQTLECSFDDFKNLVQSGDYLAKDLALDLFRMEKEGKLEAFKRRLFGH